jgi:hypothetical protein
LGGFPQKMRPPKEFLPGACALERFLAPISCAPKRSDVLEVRSGQLSALAHDLIVELLPLVQVAHSGALDCGNMHEHVLPAIGRLNEAETLLGIEKFDCTLSHVRPSFATPIGVYALHDIAQPCVRIQRSLAEEP